MKTQIKLTFDSEHNSKLVEFITHLESLSDVCNFVVAGEALLLEYDVYQWMNVYYYSWADCYQYNNPIIAIDRDCKHEALTGWDLEQLEMKSYTKM
ncbi:hypothetical protein VPIG_00072 [Vibrio phage PWH3a-P1]|uniref:hypothetical protein n=1 Tax=Vibrio phage PWH3a-P1 TaxID=754058 RepID=UPI0002C0A5E1|nr:hypothetical protein VPIG_00072 [Vibrio phage PWH3a-P1]AGH31930.1 hypothetical protein VPIG_00072 [Vibrio phage PWH3a-P1]